MNRRGFLIGALAAPAVIRTPGLLMPVRQVAWPPRVSLSLSRLPQPIARFYTVPAPWFDSADFARRVGIVDPHPTIWRTA